MRAIVTSAGTANAIGLIRAFHDVGWQVISTDINPYGYTAGSQIANEFRRVPLATYESFADTIVSVAEETRADLLVPINDAEVEVLSIIKSALPAECACVVPAPEAVAAVRDKRCATELAQQIGIPCPDSVDIDDRVCRCVRERVSVGSKGVALLSECDAAPDNLRSMIANGEAFAQRWLPGNEWTVDVLSDLSGRPLVAIPRKRIEVKAGVATKTVITRNPHLERLTKDFCESVGIPGFSNVQFKEDDAGLPRFIEANPRFGGCSAAVLATCPHLFEAFLSVAGRGDWPEGGLGPVMWDSVVTRHYVEVVYVPQE